MDNKKYDVSIIVLTYNPDIEELKKTLLSAMWQKKIKKEIIVADDGSKNLFFDEVKHFFEIHQFNDYILLPAEQNQGTTLNFYNGVCASRGKYIKGISPGDYFATEESIWQLYDNMERNKIKVCFGDAIYYKRNELNAPVLYRHKKSSPALKFVYKKEKYTYLRKMFFIVLRQRILGPAVLMEKDLTRKYCEEIIHKIKYQEDSIFALMLLDEVNIAYYSVPIIYYEFGEGVSTTKSEYWLNTMRKELAILEQIIANRSDGSKFVSKCKKLFSESGQSRVKKHLCRIFNMPDAEFWWFLSKAFILAGGAKTVKDFDFDYLSKLEGGMKNASD